MIRQIYAVQRAVARALRWGAARLLGLAARVDAPYRRSLRQAAFRALEEEPPASQP